MEGFSWVDVMFLRVRVVALQALSSGGENPPPLSESHLGDWLPRIDWSLDTSMRLEEVWCHAWIVPSGLVGISKGGLSAFTVSVSVITVSGVVWRRASPCDWG